MSATTATQEFTVTLPVDVIDIVRARVSSGDYASESDFIEAAIVETLLPAYSTASLEEWIATEGVRRYDAMKANPSRGLTHEEVFASLGIDEEEQSSADGSV